MTTNGRNPVVGTRERIVAAAYELYTRRGIRGVSDEEIAVSAGTSRAAVRQHFDTIESLVRAVLARREELWTFQLIEEQSHIRGCTPGERLLAIFDVFDEWFAAGDFDACIFITVLLEMGAEHPLGRAGIEHLQHIRDIVSARAAQAGINDPDGFARCWHILMKGAIVAAAEGDRFAARRAKVMATYVLAASLPKTTAHSTRPEQSTVRMSAGPNPGLRPTSG